MVTTQAETEPGAEFEAACLKAYTLWQTSDLSFRKALEQLAALGQQALESGHLANQGRVEHLLGNMQGRRGNFNASLMHFQRARDLYQQVENWWRVAAMEHNIGETYRYKGDYNRARQLFRKAYEIAGKNSIFDLQTMAITNEGLMLVSMERYEAARTALEEARALYERWTEKEPRRPGVLAEIYYGLSVIYLQRAETDTAWEYARQSLLHARESGEALFIGIAQRGMGDVVTALDSPARSAIEDEAFPADPDIYYHEAITRLREAKAEAELARTLLAHGRSLAQRGRTLNAARQLQQAMILFTRLDMVADAAKAAKAQLEVTA